MKRFLCTPILFLIMLAAFRITVNAEFRVNFIDNENISVSQINLSEIGSAANNADNINIAFYHESKDEKEYSVEYSLNGEKSIDAGLYRIRPYENINKKIRINAKNGKHILNITIKEKNRTVFEYSDNFVVMEKYKHQFMDEFNNVGVNVHFSQRKNANASDPRKSAALSDFNLLKYAGISTMRDGVAPYATNTKPGKFSLYIADWVGWWFPEFKNSGLKMYPLYQPGGPAKSYNEFNVNLPERAAGGKAPRTPEAIDEYANGVVNLLKELPSPEMVELCNEPNIASQWLPAEGACLDYTNLIKRTALRVRNSFDNVRLDAYALANVQWDWVLDSALQGAYPYFDALSCHPYCQWEEMEKNDLLGTRIRDAEDTVLKMGGWKDVTISEFGVPTYNGNNCTEEMAAQRLFKQLTEIDSHDIKSAIIYDLVNDGKDDIDREANYGLVTYDKEIKNGYIAVANHNTEFAGAIYLGRIPFEDERLWAYLYSKDGALKMVMWYYSEEGETKDVDFGNESLVLRDIYGNKVAENVSKITFGMSPYVIDGLSGKWCDIAINTELKRTNNIWREHYSKNIPDNIKLEAETLFDNAQDSVLSQNLNAEAVKTIINNYFALGNKILDAGKNGTINETEVSKMIFELYKSAKILEAYYIVLYDEGTPVITADLKKVEKIRSERYYDEIKMKQYSNEIFRHGRRYYNNALKVQGLEDNSQKNGVIAAYNIMAENLFAWFEKFSSFESSLNYGVTIQVPGYDTTAFVSENKPFAVSLKNQSKSDFSGTLKIYDDKGNVISDSYRVNLPVGTTLEKEVYALIPPKADDSDCEFIHFVLEDNENQPFVTQTVKLTVKKSISVKMLPIETTASELKALRFKIINNRNEKIDCRIEFTPDENIVLLEDSKNITLEPMKETVIEIPVTDIKSTKFHFYSIDYEAEDTQGNILAKANVLLDFVGIVKADNKISIDEFTGDISDWHDAYPIYMGIPENSSSKQDWMNANLAARIMMKWDEEHLYVLADVYDDVHTQNYSGKNIWQGDSVQIGFDSDNTKSKSYDADDYEIGATLNALGEETCAWQGEPNLADFKNWLKIVRNDDNHNTRYLLAVPKTALPNLKLLEGSQFGINFAANDCDMFMRESFIEYTLGLASSKNPSLWNTFALRPAAAETYVDGKAKEVFPQ